MSEFNILKELEMSNKNQEYESYGLMVSPPEEEKVNEVIKQDPKNSFKNVIADCNNKLNKKKKNVPQYNVTSPLSNTSNPSNHSTPTLSPQSVQIYHPPYQNIGFLPPSSNFTLPSNSCKDHNFNAMKPPTGRESPANAQAYSQPQSNYSHPPSNFAPQSQQQHPQQQPAGGPIIPQRGGIYSATDRETPFQYYMLDQEVPVLTQGTVYPGHLLPMAQALTEIINHLSILPGCPAPPMGRIWEALEVGIGACGDGRRAGLAESDSLQMELCGLLLVRAGLYMKSGYRSYASTDLQYILNHIDPYCDEAHTLLEELES